MLMNALSTMVHTYVHVIPVYFIGKNRAQQHKFVRYEHSTDQRRENMENPRTCLFVRAYA